MDIYHANPGDDRSMSNTLVREVAVENGAEYRAMFRIEEADFDYLLNLVSPLIAKQPSRTRCCGPLYQLENVWKLLRLTFQRHSCFRYSSTNVLTRPLSAQKWLSEHLAKYSYSFSLSFTSIITTNDVFMM